MLVARASPGNPFALAVAEAAAQVGHPRPQDVRMARIWVLARLAPTAANTQPLRVLHVRFGDGRERLLRHMADGNKDKTRSAPAVAVLARRDPGRTPWGADAHPHARADLARAEREVAQ